MTRQHILGHAFALLLALPGAAAADPMLIARFDQPGQAESWTFFTDQVMGGVSAGQAGVTDGVLTLTGTVSTANNGGFIQVRSKDIALTPDISRIVLRTRGDGQTYFIHLRTNATRLPWQYYQASFTAPADWTEVALPLEAFKPSGALLPKVPKAERIRSIALVAYGRDHAARVSLSEIRAE